MRVEEITTEVLVVGGGTGGTAAALQAARRGVSTILVSEFPWLGGMLTSAGVSAPDGNELLAFQTGIWGAFLRELRHQQPGGLDHAWVSFFTYDPCIGAEIFANWVRALPNLHWIVGGAPLEVCRSGDRLTSVRFPHFQVHAQIILDGTELGDLLALGNVPHYWGWEMQTVWGEPSAPTAPNALTQHYSVQSPTWVVVLQDFGAGTIAPEIVPPPIHHPDNFAGAWDHYGAEVFLNYGRLPGDRFMINWPSQGNDYGEGVDRLIQSPQAQAAFLQECLWHSQSFACHIQTCLGRRYGLALNTFPLAHPAPLTFCPPATASAYALHPYYRESRRLQGLATIREQDILPMAEGRVAALPLDADGQVQAIALGNYANDHHYPGYSLPLQSKSIRWGGRWTGTPFTIPYGALIPATVDGLLVCEKNSSVSHIANGATRLQPTVLGIGQAAGMAAALCIAQQCQPRDLPVRQLQEALLTDPIAPLAVIPLFDALPNHPDWLEQQQYYLAHPDQYPPDGTSGRYRAITSYSCPSDRTHSTTYNPAQIWQGVFHRQGDQDYTLTLVLPSQESSPRSSPELEMTTNEQVRQAACLTNQVATIALVTLDAAVDSLLATLQNDQPIQVWGRYNPSGNWLLVETISILIAP